MADRVFDHWMRASPEDPDRDALTGFMERSKSGYLKYERGLCGRGVFVLSLQDTDPGKGRGSE